MVLRLPGLGILGGTFDPVHLGHLRAAAAVREKLGLAEVRLIPAALPPHRDAPSASNRDRLAMVALAVRDFPGLLADDREMRRPGKSYTIDTLRELRAEFPSRALYLIVGADAFLGLATWHRWRELTDFAHLVVVDRPGVPGLKPSEPLAGWLSARHGSADGGSGSVMFLEVPPWPIAARDIRRRIGRGEEVADLLPPAVLAYIRQHRLYQWQADGSTKT